MHPVAVLWRRGWDIAPFRVFEPIGVEVKLTKLSGEGRELCTP